MESPQPPEAAPAAAHGLERQWLDDFVASARSTCAQVALAADTLEQAVGPDRFAVLAPIYLRHVVESSAEMANLQLSERLQLQQQQQMARAPRPADPAWAALPNPAIARFLNPYGNHQ